MKPRQPARHSPSTTRSQLRHSHHCRIPALVISGAIAYAMLTCVATSSAVAKPETWGDSVIKPPRWPKNSEINVYIQPDPKSQGRDQLVKEGVERWKQRLTPRMVTVNVTIGNPPAGAANPVTYQWADDGTKTDDGSHELGAGKDDAFAGPNLQQDTDPDGKPIAGSEKFTGGEAKLRNALPSANATEKDYLRNLAEHEFTHIIGLADDDNGSVTKHEQPDTPRAINDEDLKEINSLYGAAATGGAVQPQGILIPQPGGPGFGSIDYLVAFAPSHNSTDPEDAEHIALMTFGIDPALVASIDAPPGWVALIPHGPVAPSDPYFAESNLDADLSPSPFDPDSPPTFVALQTSVAEAIRDGLSPGVDPALSLDNPNLVVRFHLAGPVRLGSILAWAGGDLQTVLGPVAIPEPSTLIGATVVSAAVLLTRGTRRKRGRPA